MEKTTHIRSNRKEDIEFNLSCDKHRFHICPVGVVSEESNRLLKMFFICKEFKCLPDEGALLDQDNRIIEAFELINTTINKFENSEIEKQKREIKSNNGNNK